MAGTTSVTIVRDYYFHGDADEYSAPSGRVHYD